MTSLYRLSVLALLLIGSSLAFAQDVDSTATDFDVTLEQVDGDSIQATVTLAEPDSVVATPVVEEADGEGNAGWLSIIPALLAIVLALAFRQVVVSLFAGVWVGAWIVTGEFFGLFTGLWRTIDTYLLTALADSDHASIIIFSLMIGGTVGIIQKNGGTAGIVKAVTKWASTGRRGQISTAILGSAIFFDDYANTLIVGGTMRPITDRLKISREKLAYLVDSTAAPVASVALVTTWIGYEVGLIGEATSQIAGFEEGAYSIFLNSIAYSFYPILALFFVFAVAISRRDFGPMLKAERRARTTGQLFDPDSSIAAVEEESSQLQPPDDKPHRLINAVLPILTLVVVVLGALYTTGRSSVLEMMASGDESVTLGLRDIIAEASSYKAMMWGSVASVVVAVLMTLSQRILTLTQAVDAWYAGVRSMLLAIIILLLAWSLSNVNGALGTADFLVEGLSGSLAPWMLPFIIFLLAAATAFATGSSWGTMGILMPLVIPLVVGVLDGSGGMDGQMHILYSSVSVVLAGAVWGDHCSPISDTTILSSLASSCDHIDHVRTQLPYAMTVGIVALLGGTLPSALGMPWWIGMIAGALVLFAILRFVGQPVDDSVATES